MNADLSQPPGPPTSAAGRAPSWQLIVAPVGSVLTLLGLLALAALFGPTIVHEAQHDARPGVMALELLPFLPPVAGAAVGVLVGRRLPAVTTWCYAALGALLGLAVSAVALYGVVAVVTLLFARDFRF